MAIQYLFLSPGLDPRQGGIQVSAIDALAGTSGRCVKTIVFGNDPLAACPNPHISLCKTGKVTLALHMLMRNWSADVAVCWHISMLKLLPFARGFRGKVVVFLHGIEAWRPQNSSLSRKLEKVDLFLSNSDFTWHEFLRHMPQLAGKPHTTTPLGFGEPIPIASETPKRSSMLIIARLSKAEDYKGHRELIAAWPSVLNVIPNAKLDIVGEGDLRSDLEAMVYERSIQENVKFHGRVDEVTKERLLRECSAFAMPSRGEGFGIVYLEAMRYGRPCLVSDRDAGREVVNPPEAGLEVRIGDTDAVANAIVQILSGGSRWQEWSAAAVARYERLFTVSAFQQRLFLAIDGMF